MRFLFIFLIFEDWESYNKNYNYITKTTKKHSESIIDSFTV